MDGLVDCILIKILQWLDVRHLCICSQVCHDWRRVAYDSELWADINLCPFRWKLDEQAIVRLIHTRFQPLMRKLNLTSFSLTPKMFTELQVRCPNLQSLILENVNFIGFSESYKDSYNFPERLFHLDIRYSSGDPIAYEIITENLTTLHSIGITNSLLSSVNNIKIIRNLRNIRVLDFSHCNSLNDATLVLLGTFCTKLTSLSLNHCNNVRGNDLSFIIEHCPLLKALCFNGTSLDDTSLLRCNWGNIALEELDISWCRNITERGLIQVLPCLKNLEYLRLCSCGFGHAITDNVLQVLTGHQKLQFVDVSYSREITDEGVSKAISTLPSLKQIRINSCRKLSPRLFNMITANDKVLVIPSFVNTGDDSFQAGGNSLFAASRLMVSITQPCSELRKYTLDNMLQKPLRNR
eukprot:TCONS_00052558-protein